VTVDSTDERLARLEQRVEAVETLIEDVRAKISTWAESPAARKLAKMFGVSVN
jgi:hypothetical protein